MSGPCIAWAELEDMQLCSDCATFDDEVLAEEYLDVASELLYLLSARRYTGICSTTVRPCGNFTDVGDYWVRSAVWRGGCYCNLGPKCGCRGTHEIKLGKYPIISVTEVLVAGDSNPDWPDTHILDPMYYKVVDKAWLMRLANPDGRNPGWPCCQRIDLEPPEEHTFEVSFQYGRAPSRMAKRATADLACQLALACSGGKCKLPSRVVSIVRQGVQMVLLDPFAFFKEGKTGVYSVDLFLSTINPRGYRSGAEIVSPDVGREVRRTDSGSSPS